MKRLFFAVAVLMLVASPACAELCAKCAKLNYTQDVGTCVVCGGETSSGAFKLCKACSRKLGQCEHCRAALTGAKARPARGAIIDLHKSGSYNIGRWRYDYTISAAGSRSEGRHGVLTYGGKPIPGVQQFDRIDTPWGMMQFFGPKPHRWGNGGWLLKQCYDRPIDPKKGRLLTPPGRRQTLAVERADRLKKDLENFVLRLEHFGGRAKPFYGLTLSTRPIPRRATSMFDLSTVVSRERTLKIIDHLIEDGFMHRAEKTPPMVDGTRALKVPCYVLRVTGGDTRLQESLGWGLPMLKRLDALRTVLDGDPAKKMDLLLGRLSGLRKAWMEAEQARAK